MEVTPLSYTGLDTEPYNDFSLNCTATKPPEVIPSILLTWFHNVMRLDASVLGVSISEDESNSGAVKSSQLALSVDNSSDSGSYSCQATISIPDSDTVESSQTSIVTIIGNSIVHNSTLDITFSSIFLSIKVRHYQLLQCCLKMLLVLQVLPLSAG